MIIIQNRVKEDENIFERNVKGCLQRIISKTGFGESLTNSRIQECGSLPSNGSFLVYALI
jgi:hypothetical protein